MFWHCITHLNTFSLCRNPKCVDIWLHLPNIKLYKNCVFVAVPNYMKVVFTVCTQRKSKKNPMIIVLMMTTFDDAMLCDIYWMLSCDKFNSLVKFQFFSGSHTTDMTWSEFFHSLRHLCLTSIMSSKIAFSSLKSLGWNLIGEHQRKDENETAENILSISFAEIFGNDDGNDGVREWMWMCMSRWPIYPFTKTPKKIHEEVVNVCGLFTRF